MSSVAEMEQRGVPWSDVTRDTPLPMGLVDTVGLAWHAALDITPYGPAQDLMNAENANIEAMRKAGIPQEKIPQSLGMQDFNKNYFSLGGTLSAERSFMEDAYPITYDKGSRDEASQKFWTDWGDREKQLQKLQQEYPGVGIKTYREMADQVRTGMQGRQTDISAQHGFWRGAAWVAGNIGAGLDPRNLSRDPIMFAFNALSGVASGGQLAVGRSALTRIASAYGINLGAQFVDDLTGTNKTLRMLGYDEPTIGQTLETSALGAALPTAIFGAGELFRARRLRINARREALAAPEPVPARPTPAPAAPEPPLYGVGDFRQPDITPESRRTNFGSHSAGITAHFAGPDTNWRVRFGIDADNAERQLSEWGVMGSDITPVEGHRYDLAPHDPAIAAKFKSMGVTTKQELDNVWRASTVHMTPDEAARAHDPQTFKTHDNLVAAVARELQKDDLIKRMNAEKAAGVSTLHDAAQARELAIIKGKATIAAKQAAAKRFAERQAAWEDKKPLPSNKQGVIDARSALYEHGALVRRAYQNAAGIWQLDRANVDRLNAGVERQIERALRQQPQTVNFTGIEKGTPPEIDRFGSVVIPELAHDAAQAVEPGRPKVDAVDAANKVILKEQLDHLDASEKMIKDIQAQRAKGGPIVIDIAGIQHEVHLGDGDIASLLDDAENDIDLTKAALSCQTRL